MLVIDFQRKIKSFVRREGRMTPGQAKAYENMMPEVGVVFTHQLIDFSALWSNGNPVILEIGFGMGASLAQQAKSNPEINYLGIEVHRPGVGSLLSRVEQDNLSNVRVICHDAVEVLEHMIKDNSLAGVQLFFPDPWHKKRHHKRRIVNQAFVQLISRKVNDAGFFHLATDWQNYAEHMLAVMQEDKGWKNLSPTGDFIERPESRPVTKFENRGKKLGHGVWDLMFVKCDN